ncbi:MAG: chromate transporter [Spirochaetaceae bacterium]|jgi:chromate transporter|nr:chromate transporter [Spirochaetaceae bacterium]
MKALAELFFVFFRISLTTFGGGYAILPVLERELILRRGWISLEEVMDYYTIGQVTPGVIAVNTATFIGYKRGGLPGGFIATLGFICPSLILVLAVALGLSNFADLPVVQHAFRGIRVAVGALILDTVIKMLRGVFAGPKGSKPGARIITLILFLGALALTLFLSLSPVLVVLAAGGAGFLFFRPGPPERPPPGEGRGAE